MLAVCRIILSDTRYKGTVGRMPRGRSRSRSRDGVDWAREKGKTDKELVEEMRKADREKAVCSSGKEYARKPVGYKAACALPREQGAASHRLMEEETFVPMKQVRRRSPSPSKAEQDFRRNVHPTCGLSRNIRAVAHKAMAAIFSPGRGARPAKGALMVATAAAVLTLSAFSSDFLYATRSPLRPTVQSPSTAETHEAVTSTPASQEGSSFASGSSLLLFAVSAVIARNVAMYGASPKGKRAHWRTHRDKVRWYKRGELQAKRALALGRGIRNGTIDFIYGKPQDDDDNDDFDDEYDDDEDDDELENQQASSQVISKSDNVFFVRVAFAAAEGGYFDDVTLMLMLFHDDATCCLPLAAMSSPAASGTPSPPGESPEATPSGSAHRTLQEHPNRFTLALSEAEKGCLSPRSGRKSGVQSFTDPMNPFARVTSKAITNLQEARNDPERAGARTRTPGMIPVKESSDRHWASSKKGSEEAASMAHLGNS
ncbi:hypothetical protein AK812_SmicGene15907 [Symbiodinium microadriaticum]|uniref:Uncharacterized protein n=1 Tax=Symbiodinium microadriaticum TaxID=2951 RepID=A0A1Q9E1R9_SYMMI|nr:hypothetical protein AK812_SmicGene15907 [Symbiodinium microadriaticum]